MFKNIKEMQCKAALMEVNIIFLSMCSKFY